MSRYLGIDLGGSTIKWTVLENSAFTPVETEETPGDKKAILSSLSGIIEREERLRGAMTAVCIGTPGLVDGKGRIRGDAVNLPGWGNQSPGGSFGTLGDRSPIVKNDGSLATLAEARLGAARDRRNVVGIFIGTGIGGGLIIDGNIYEGTAHLAGEVGHVVVEPGGAPCPCGKRGCVERYSSGTGMVRLAQEEADRIDSPLAEFLRKKNSEIIANGQEAREFSAERMYQDFYPTDELARTVHEISVDRLARLVGALINILAPEKLVLGGGVMKSADPILRSLKKKLPQYAVQEISKGCHIVPASLGSGAGAIGAALYASSITD
ncbi:MAG TPA: ROK family protein [Sediminispirochaeta sp.]|nr:ROK family protein [Sediminispirochaeta sp.]